MRAFFPDGWIATVWPRRSVPPVNVPVTTVPMPCNLKTRSTGNRGLPMFAGGGVFCQNRCEGGFQMVEPRPVTTDVGTIGASANGVSRNFSRIAATHAIFVLC